VSISEAEASYLVEQTKDWSPKARAAALEALEERRKNVRRAWYCTLPGPGDTRVPGRACNGRPHEGYMYAHARADQWPPPRGDWFVWMLRGGRGSGKTRSGAEWARTMSKKTPRMALVARTTGDVRDTLIEGESGLQSVCMNAGEKIQWEPSKHRVTFENGAIAQTYSAEEPDRLRGPQHGAGWCDEPAHYPAIDDVWSNLLLGMRLGNDPKIALTTTPKTNEWMRELIKEKDTVAVRASTYENLENLAPSFARTVLKRYEGTRLGLQELHGELLEDVEGAMWDPTMIHQDYMPLDLDRIVVAVDPAGTKNARSDETGIIVVGRKGDVFWVLEDLTAKMSPNEWATAAFKARAKWVADAIVFEKNFGGDMVRQVLDTTLDEHGKKMGEGVRLIETFASRGKQIRAEPTVGFYEQGRVIHKRYAGLDKLENEQLTWVPGEGASPNRVDALVWGITELAGTSEEASLAAPKGRMATGPTGRASVWSRLGPLKAPTPTNGMWARR